jgi:hypothetical protein
MRIATILGVLFIVLAGWNFACGSIIGGVILLLVGASLTYLGIRPGRKALVVFGHACIVMGCILITWGLYMLPECRPTVRDVFTRPLFWGLFSLFGGLCALFHGFCNCVRSCGREFHGKADVS